MAAPVAMPPASLTPDRRRIDSDVRCFLRQPSTPWITFDKDGRPSQVAVGEVLTSARRSIAPEIGFFPAEPAGASAAPDAQAEPSSLVVASDVVSSESVPAMRLVESDPFASGAGSDTDEAAFLPRRPGRRALAVAAVVTGFAAVVAVGLAITAASSASLPEAGARTQSLASPSLGAAPASEPRATSAAPVDLPPDLAAAASMPAAKTPSPPVEDAKPAAPKFGRLTINGRARYTHVFLDGKRLLGKGARSFVVICGAHQIAVGDKADAKDVDVPCNAEMVISQ